MRPKSKLLKTLLVDGSVLFKRSYHGNANTFFKGDKVGAIHSFITTLKIILSEHNIQKAVVFWDGGFSGKLRYEIDPFYKSNRNKNYSELPEQEEDYIRQKLRIKQYLEELCIRQMEDEVTEADDCIAYYTQNKRESEQILIYTSDHDLMQLLREDVSLYLSDKKQLITTKNASSYLGYDYRNAALVKIFEGCVSDSILGIDRVGGTTLVNLFPVLKERPATVNEILEAARGKIQERKTDSIILENIVTGKTKAGTIGLEIYDRNRRLVDLSEPLLTDAAREEIDDMIHRPMNIKGRDIKNVIKFMNEDGYKVPNGMDRFHEFMMPFLVITKTEEAYYKSLKPR